MTTTTDAKPPMVLPDSERGRSAHDIAMLDRINARLARGYKPRRGKTAEEQREDDLRLRAELEQSAGRRDDERQRRAREEETVALAQGRGETVDTDRSGVRRIIDRDPLLSLLRSGAITKEQFEVGQAIRDLYELRQGDASSAPFDGMPSAAHDHERFIASRFIRAKAAVPVGQLETALLNGHYRNRDGMLYVLKTWPDMIAAGMEPHIALRVMRWVCCAQNTLTSMGKGRAYDRHRRALVFALEVADEVIDSRTAARKAG